MSELTLGKLIADLQAVQDEHGPETLVSMDGYSDELLVVKTSSQGRHRGESGDKPTVRVILDIASCW